MASKDEEINLDAEKKSELEGGDESVSVTESVSTAMSSPGRKQLMMAVNSSLQSLDPLSLLKPVQQAIHCIGDDKHSSFAVYGNDVTVFPCEYDAAHKNASSKIRFSQVCKYDWDQRYYFGDLIASSKKYVAYVVGAKTSRNEHVRVINHITSSRVLLKGFEGKVTCLTFGGPDDSHIACMDMTGNLRIFLLSEDDDNMTSELVLEVLRHHSPVTEFSLVSWAQSMIDDDHDDVDAIELIVAITHVEKADVLSVNAIIKEHGRSCTLEDIVVGRKSIREGHSKPITQFVVSPNYEVLATSSLDGFIKMWNISFESGESPSCLHEWQPHDGEPVTGLFFCDNQLAEEETVSSWRFVITGAKYNSEIKVWCSVSWKCLQILRFGANPSTNPSNEQNPFPRLKAALDKSAMFFILSDVKRQVLYVLQLYQDNQEGTAHFTSLTEFILTQPMLCYSVYHTKVIKRSKSEEDMEDANGDDADQDDDDDDNEDARDTSNQNEQDEDIDSASDVLGSTAKSSYQVSLKMFGIHVKSLQKLHMKYSPSWSVPPAAPSVYTAISSEDHMSIRDGMSDITEGQCSVISDQEDADSFATAALKVANIDGLKSNASSLTTVSHSGASETHAVENILHLDEEEQKRANEEPLEQKDDKEEELRNSSEEDEKRLDADEKAGVYPEENEEERRGTADVVKDDWNKKERKNVSDEESDKSSRREDSGRSPEGDIEKNIHSDLDRASLDTSSSSASINAKTGVIKIFKRPDTANEPKKPSASAIAADAKVADKRIKKSTSEKEIARRQLMAELGIMSPDKSISLMNKGGKEQKSVKKASPDLSISSLVDDSMTIQTGDLLGLDFNSDVPFGEKKSRSATPENSQPIGTILKMLQDQQKHIAQLTRTVQDLSTQLSEQTKRNDRWHRQQAEEREQMKTTLQLIQKTSGQGLSKAVKEVSKACSQRLDSFNSTVQADFHQAQERQLQVLGQAVNSAITGKLDKIVKSELKTTLLPNLQKPVSFAMEQVSSHVSTRLTAIEKILREEVATMIKSKAVAESIGFSAATLLEGILPNAYREVFENTLIPSYERSCNEMFAQISREFEKGTKSHFERMDSYFKSRKQRDIDSRDPVLKQLQGLGQTFQDTADRLTGIESNLLVLMEKQITDSVHKLKNELVVFLDQKMSQGLMVNLKDVMEKSLSQLKNDLTTSLQGMATAQENMDITSPQNLYNQIDKNIQEMDYLDAFNAALTAGDLSFVLYVCQKVDAEDLFTKNGSALTQPVILSLIQQLSADLTSDTDIKVNYLSEAITALDQTDEITAEYMPRVLENLSEQVSNAMSLLRENDPNSQNIKQLKFLRQLVRAAFKGASA